MEDRIESIKEMLETDPNDSFLNYALALEYDKQGNSQKAISIISSILKQDEDYLGGYYKLGQLFEQKNELPEAVKIYKKGRQIALKQQDEKALGELSEALMIISEDDDDWEE